MTVTTKLNVDLVHPGLAPEMDATQDDRCSRALELTLWENGVAFPVPEDCTVLIRYGKPDGRGGAYDTLPDGTTAYSISGNTVTVYLTPQVCTVPGRVALAVTLFQGDGELTCFQVWLNVHPVPRRAMDSRKYVNITGFLPQPGEAAVGQYLRVAAVDSAGKVTAVETADGAAGLPEAAVEGAFLRVVDGVWAAVALESAEEVSF